MFAHPPTILLHGFSQTVQCFRPVLLRIDKRFDLRPQALPGHLDGLTLERGEPFDAVVDRVAAELIGRGMRDLHLVGYSLGARVALALLVRHRALFRAATLIGVHPGLSEPSERAARAQRDAQWIETLRARGVEEFAQKWEQQPLFATQTALPESVRSEQRAERLRHDPEQLARALESLGLAQMPCFLDDLPGLTQPVDLLAGAADESFCALAEKIASRLPRARVGIIPRAGHNAVLENPLTVARWIEERASV